MWQQLSERLYAWRSLAFNRQVRRILALPGQGNARKDSLTLNALRTNLQLEWRARDIHPWDRLFPPEKRAALFVQQVLADTGLVISNLFHSISSVESVEVRVLDPKAECVIMNGIVQRANLSLPRPKSDRIWLGQLGIRFRLVGNRFEPLSYTDLSGAA